MSTRQHPTAAQQEVVAEFAPDVEIRLSAKRRRTIAARMEAGKVVVLAPLSMSAKELRSSATELVEKVKRRHTGASQTGESDALMRRARTLNQKYLENRAEFTSVKWVTNMSRRWGSCSVDSGRIRISSRLKDVPEYVLDSVLIHEMVHTWIPDHGPEFKEWAAKAPYADRATGYLEAYSRWAPTAS
ncbi:SprT-like domain-containing protein [Corynebacterium sp.]|jgi:predicted metal-dependent hydrolase|uniref:M48 metallopeptidase family protein n=1 Tax=Corynebacterium sp. TaxID=1720 RepID=UPI0025C2888E|nr:SprT-like domain-containing protein [Corynebacterium sp.]